MEQFNVLLEPVRAFLLQLGEFLPRILVAILILVAGWLVAKAVKFAIIKALRAINFNVLTEKAGIDGFLQEGGGQIDTTGIIGVNLVQPPIIANASTMQSPFARDLDTGRRLR